ncbi:MAG: aminopeptidase P family protein [Fimbriimonadaceae bacterium]|nr:aminopeptidase P family protein [Fimbriimonadaceae bacterium]QYK55786.1 MAG: aminopeptidase P family protein [Fimbriimonadaceae bacterium]
MAASIGKVDQLAKALARNGVDVFLASSQVTLEYLTGFAEDGHERLLFHATKADGNGCLVCPSLTETHARKAGLTDVRPWHDSEGPDQAVLRLAEEWNLRSAVIAVDDEMRASSLLKLQELLPGALFRPGSSILAELTKAKTAEELASLRRAGQIADAALPKLLGTAIKPGVTERQAARALLEEMERLGGTPTFCIAAFGPNSAEPHHETGDRVLGDNEVALLDFGCLVNGYHSDITRCLAFGDPDPEVARVYEVVHAAFLAGMEAVRPGVPAEEVDRAARKVIEDAGYGPNFVHRLGHGVGRRGHEPPYICEGETQPLGVGNVFSIEPGVYLPGRFGIRIENLVAVTDGGFESLNEMPSPTLPVV